MKRVIVLAVVAASMVAVYSLAQEAAAPKADEAAKAQPKAPAMMMGCCPGCMMVGGWPRTGTGPVTYVCPMHPQVRAAAAGACPMCGMALVKRQQGAAGGPQGSMQPWMGMMRQAGMPAAMTKRIRVLMQTPVFVDSPSAIYGQAQALGLSEQQKKSLMVIEQDARKKALAVLSPEQRRKMGDMPDKPMTMMQMCRQMRARMMGMMRKAAAGKGQAGPMMMCPMMRMMAGQAAKTGPDMTPAK